jgi:hypothetical protein
LQLGRGFVSIQPQQSSKLRQVSDDNATYTRRSTITVVERLV